MLMGEEEVPQPTNMVRNLTIIDIYRISTTTVGTTIIGGTK